MAAGDLTTLAAVRAYLGIAAADTSQDALLTSLVAALSKRFAEEADRLLESGSRTDTADGDGGTSLLLAQYPITAVASVLVDGEAIPARTTVDGDGYVVVDGIRIELVGYEFSEGVQNVVVSYTAGYTTIPVDIAEAVNEWVGWIHRGRSHIGLQSQSMEGATVSFSPYGAPLSVQAVIDSYRRREIR